MNEFLCGDGTSAYLDWIVAIQIYTYNTMSHIYTSKNKFHVQAGKIKIKSVCHMSILLCKRAKSLQSSLTLLDRMNYSPPGHYIHEILQARILEWVAIPSSRGSSQPRVWTPHFFHILTWQVSPLSSVPPMKSQLYCANVNSLLFAMYCSYIRYI